MPKAARYRKADKDRRGRPKVGHSNDQPPFGPIRVHRLVSFGLEMPQPRCEAVNDCNAHAEYQLFFFASQDYACGFRHVKEAKLCGVHTRGEF